MPLARRSNFRDRDRRRRRVVKGVRVATIPFILFQTVRWGGITHFLTDTVVDLIGFLTLIYLLDFLAVLATEQRLARLSRLSAGDHYLDRLHSQAEFHCVRIRNRHA